MIKKDIFLNFLCYSVVFVISICSFYYGREYSLYHTDLIHWNFQLDTMLAINGKELYKDIFLQYGEGIVTFFPFVNNFYKIDIYSLRMSTNFICIKIFLIYQISLLITHSKYFL